MKSTTSKENPSNPASKFQSETKKVGFCSKIYNLLFHDDLYYRIGGFLIFGLLLFFVTWALFEFVFKSPGLLRDSFVVRKWLFKNEVIKALGPWGDQTFQSVWNLLGLQIKVGNFINVAYLTLKYFVNHLVFVVFFIFIFNLFKVGRWNLSIVYFVFYTILWGVATASNSIPFPYGPNQAVGGLILFARFGLWTWFSYMLLLISTTQFAWLGTSSWTSWDWEQKRKIWPVSFSKDQLEIFIYGLLFLLASSLAEANIYVHYNGI